MASIQVVFNNEEILKVELVKNIYVIGREATCEIHIDNLGISRAHARLIREGNTYVLEDLNSANGVFLNGEKIQRHPLTANDEFIIGKYFIKYTGEVSGSAVPMPQAETVPESGAVGNKDSGGAFNTMAMDGDAMRKRIEEMKRQKDAEKNAAAPAPAAAAPAATPTPAVAVRQSRTTEIQKPASQGKPVALIVVGVLILIALIVVIVLLVNK